MKVVDASALAALFFGEAEAEAITAQMNGAKLIAPFLLDFELANVCISKMRRDRTRQDEYLENFALLDAMPIERLAVDQHAVLRLAQVSGLTAYDASYLWLARQHNAGLVTLDKQLAAAFSP